MKVEDRTSLSFNIVQFVLIKRKIFIARKTSVINFTKQVIGFYYFLDSHLKWEI